MVTQSKPQPATPAAKTAAPTAAAPEPDPKPKLSAKLSAALAKAAKANENLAKEGKDKLVHAEEGPDGEIQYRWYGRVPQAALTEDEVKALEGMK